ncbi:hypothetical protein V8J36_06880 [Frigidibacter sp. MR17.14]|uniref:hypothetical protein n=1 Tax=Frigidibacter sp. MR17.14 TaxID=3126509 RepID=UPI0030130B55
MSDPLSKREIDDVLSSIRRLVADEKRVADRDLTQPLVLTPALRVEPMPIPAAVAAPMATRSALRASLEETIAELEAAVAASSRAPVAASVAVVVAPAAGPASAPAPLTEDTAALARFEAELASALGRPLPPEVDPEAEAEAEAPPAPSNDLAARIAEAAARVRRRGPMPPHDPATDVEEEDDPRLSLEWAAAGEPVEPVTDAATAAATGAAPEAAQSPEPVVLRVTDPFLPAEPPLDDAAMPAATDATAAEAPAKAPAPRGPDLTAIPGRKPAAEPDAEAPETAARDWQDEPKPIRRLHLAGGLDWQPPPQPSAAGEGWPRPEDAAPDASPRATGRPLEPEPALVQEADEIVPDDDLVVDEAALKAFVSQIVREELQGALGERITHAVRKLVRHEIQRALTTRGMD